MPRKTRRQKQHADQYRGGPSVAVTSAPEVLTPSSQMSYQFQAAAPKHTPQAQAAVAELLSIQKDLIKTVVLASAMIAVIVTLARVW